MINTVLMDLDGTLLPFEQDEFIKAYFSLLCRSLAPKGYTPDAVVSAVWAGCKAMVANDGTVCNSERFWDSFAACLGEGVRAEKEHLDDFYRTAFDDVRTVLRGQSCAKELVDTLTQKGYTVVLATNPLFPLQAQLTRMAWAGLQESDFAHITHYDNCCYCKPNLRYYGEIMHTIGKTPVECLMIGNSVAEDLIAAQLGMEVYFVDTYPENPQGLAVDEYKNGSLEAFLEVARRLPSLKNGD